MVTLPSTVDVTAVQRRTVAVLAVVQVLGGIGVSVGVAVGALLGAELGNDALAGLAASASVVGAAALAVPVSKVMDVRGRGVGLAVAYAVGAVGAVVVVVAAVVHSFAAAMAGMLLVGAASAANLQGRYVATDLADTRTRGTSLSVVVWAATVGAVLGPNLTDPTGVLAQRGGLPALAGPFVLTAVAFAAASVAVWALLRPDPLRLARSLRDGVEPAPRARGSVRLALQAIEGRRSARLGLGAIAVGYAVMVGVMAMTPIHLHHGGASLTVIGMVISVHILGMYVAAPLVGIAADRLGRRPVLLAGAALLLVALAVCGTATHHDAVQLGVGLTLLGLGFSCTLVAGSTMLSEATPLDIRPAVQGTADLLMGAAGAVAALLAGLVTDLGSFGVLAAVGALLVVPLAVATLRSPRASLQT
jgi:MFS family permease